MSAVPCIPRKDGDPVYEKARVISNARFDFHPAEICYCENEADVAAALKRANGRPIRIRSGGHQHEGMCSGDGVLIIDVSRINHVQPDGEIIRIGPGARNCDAYLKIWEQRRLFPGGGCGDVRVGGLVHGGGWGPYARALGLSCDWLHSFHIVKADGTGIDVAGDRSDPNYDLYWAVCGSGGGNFGVITEYRFKLPTKWKEITRFSLEWSDLNLVVPVIDEWRKNFPDDDSEEDAFLLTTFCRASALQVKSLDQPVVVAGFFLGPEAPLKTKLEKLLKNNYAKTSKRTFVRTDTQADTECKKLFHHPDYQPGPPLEALEAPGDLLNTCDGGSYPHKVSSCFPKDDFSENAVRRIFSYLAHSGCETNARRYLSLHSLGGVVKSRPEANVWSCFPYRQKPFMLQYQAWWLPDPNDKDRDQRNLDWIKGFRDAMKPYTEGAFINFPDKDLVQHPETPQGRKDLLKFYYKDNLDRLIGVKARYDPGNIFDFPMGIPKE